MRQYAYQRDRQRPLYTNQKTADRFNKMGRENEGKCEARWTRKYTNTPSKQQHAWKYADFGGFMRIWILRPYEWIDACKKALLFYFLELLEFFKSDAEKTSSDLFSSRGWRDVCVILVARPVIPSVFTPPIPSYAPDVPL